MLLEKPIPFTFLIRRIRREVLLILLFANIVVLAKHFFHLRYMNIPIAIPTLLGTCISLLLAFRTNQAYERWWEARTVWGAIVNDSRSFIRLIQMYLPDLPDRQNIIHSFMLRQCAWCFVLGDSLREQSVEDRLREFLPPETVKRILSFDNKPNGLLLDHGLAVQQLYRDGHLTDYQMVHISTTLNNLTDSMGRCERIKSTPFPRTYTFNMHVFIYLFAAILPFCFDEDLFYLDVPLVTLISSGFLLIEKSALQLQNPFETKETDTAMTTIARNIEINLKTMTGYSPIPEKIKPYEFYAL
ncbi:bestrophin family protein [Larkinella insperata]|uniref:Bestrophin family protein n=1 Tax=Larkinella insperata TaxID=332158 RepID=A0ABW3Q6L0_9BACT|nr:bestrophin family ion channel [Larkinella insperata]